MASFVHVNSICSNIHSFIQDSGLHFVINSTPFSSYITIRKKLVDPDKVVSKESSELASNLKHCNSRHDELTILTAKYEKLRLKNNYLEEALVHVEEEAEGSEIKSKERIANLHSTIDKLETKIKSLEFGLLDRDTEIEALKKETKTKDEILQNINKGFIKKIGDLKVEIGVLEEFKQKKLREEKETLKKEQKLKKKQRQKAKKVEDKVVAKAHSDDNTSENNNVTTALAKAASVETKTHPCDYCDYSAKSEAELGDHTTEAHQEQFMKIAKKFEEHKSGFAKLLENVPECEWILTPEEITHFGVDWKIHLEILEILNHKLIRN